MAEFDISILSTLDIDANSSQKQINEKIKDISSKVNSIAVGLEVKDDGNNAEALKKSANKVINSVKDNGLKKLNVELDVDLSKSKNNINRALASITKDFANKKIDIGINAKVDNKSFEQANKEANKSTRLNDTPNNTANNVRQEIANNKVLSSSVLNLANNYKDLSSLKKALSNSTDKSITTDIKTIQDATGKVQQYIISLQKLDEMRRVSHRNTLKYDVNDSGLNLQKVTKTDASDKTEKQAQADILKNIKQLEASYDNLYTKKRISIDQLKQINSLLDETKSKASKGLANPKEFEQAKESANKLAQQMQLMNTDAAEHKKIQDGIANELRKEMQALDALHTKQKLNVEQVKQIKSLYDEVGNASSKGLADRGSFDKSKEAARMLSVEMQQQNKLAQQHEKQQEGIRDKLLAQDRIIQQHLDKGRIQEKEAERIRQIYAKIQAEAAKGMANPQEFERVKKAVDDTVQSTVRLNELLQQQARNERLIVSEIQKKSSHIDKQAMNRLQKENSGLGNATNGFGADAMFRMKEINNQVRQISAEADRATRSQLGFVESFREAMVKFPIWMGASTLFFGAIQSGKEFIDVIVDIDSKMITLAKVMGDDVDLGAIFDKANEAALNYGQTISGVLDVYAEFARQGYKGEELTKFGNAGLIAANVGEIDAKQASEYLTSMSAQWETDANQAMRQVDSLNEISNNYATTVEKIAQGQAKAGSTAKSMGMTFDETNAVIGALTAKTKQSGDEIGNFMKAILPSIYNGKGRDTIEGLGIDFKDQNGEIKGAMVLLEEVAQKVKSLDKDQQAAVINGIGGKYHYQRLQVLLDDLGKADSLYKSIKDTSENSGGSALTENAKYMESAEAKINKAKVSIEQFAIVLGDAFLKSGILDALRIFTDLMTGLVHIVEKFGSASTLFGVVGGAVALFSKNVRSGFQLSTQSIGDFIAKSYEMKQAEKNINAASNAVNGMNVGAPAPKQVSAQANTQTNSASKNNASQTNQATQANKSFADALKSVGIQGPFAAAGIEKGNRAAAASATAHRLAGVAVRGFVTALRAVASATIVGAALAGLSFVLEKVVGNFDKAKQAAEAYKQSQDQTAQALQSMPDSEINNLINKHEELKNKMNSGQTFNDKEAEDYKNTVSQLANIFPDLVTGEGKYGQTINANKAILDQRVKLTKEQLKAEQALNTYKKQQENEEFIKEQDKKAKPNKFMETLKGGNAETKLHNSAGKDTFGYADSKRLTDLSAQIRKVKDVESATKALTQAQKASAAAAQEGNTREVNAIQKKINALNQYIGKTAATDAAHKAAVSAAAQNFNATTAQMTGIGNKGQQVMGALTNAVQSTAKSGKQASDQFKIFESTLVKNTGFTSKMKTYENAVKNFKKAQESGGNTTAATKKLEKAYEDLYKDIMNSAQAAKMDKKAKSELRVSLQNLIKDETNLSAKIDKEGRVTLSTKNATDKNTSSTKKNSKAKKENADSAEEAAEKNKKLADSMREAGSKQEMLNSAMEQLNETGGLDWDTKADLVEAYGEKAVAAMQDQATMQDFLMQKTNEEADNFGNALNKKFADSTEYYNETVKADKNLVDTMAEDYGIDASNYHSISELKAGINDAYNNGSAEEQEKLVNGIAKTYGIDLSNYGSLAEKKDALETKLMELLGDKWVNYINGIADSTNSLFSALDGTPLGKIPGFKNLTQGLRGLTDNIAGLVKKNGVNAAKLIADKDDNWVKFADSGKKSSNIADKLGQSLKDVGKAAGGEGTGSSGSGPSASDGLGKMGDSLDKANDKMEETKKEAEAAGVSVELLYKTFTITTYVADKLQMALDKVNFQLEKQKLNTQKYATWSQKYRDSLAEENKLLDEKTKKLNEQIKSMKEQIEAGQVIEYGLVNSEYNAPYYKYTANGLEGGQTGAISGLVGSSNQQKVWNYLKANGFTDAQAAGIMGNFEQESRFNPAAEQMSGWVGGKGLAQWDDRKNNLKKFADARGKSWKDLNVQLDFMMHELKTTESAAYNAIKSATSVNKAAEAFQNAYERAGVPNMNARYSAANKYYNQFKGTSGKNVQAAVVSGMQGKSIVSDPNAYLYDKQFGSYNAGSGLSGPHYGRDLTSGSINNAQIRAAKAGVVTFAGWTGGGNTISIFDGTNTYTYMHMIAPTKLKKGQTVAAGQVVGNVGSTFGNGGKSTGPHLHVQVNKGKTPSGTFIDSFNGPNAAIDAQKNGYLKVGGGSGDWQSLAGADLMSGNITADAAEAYNQAEEARLAQLEQAINEHNAAEEMKQKVDELRKKLMDTQLEALQTAHQKRENLYGIHKSHAEQYDYLKELQEAKSNQLTYELNKIEFEKGRNNDEWRKKNSQLVASRELEKGHVESKKKYIQKALKEDKDGIFGEQTAYRDEFERMVREADNTIREIKEGIQHSSGEIAASLVDQILEEYELKTGDVQRIIDKLGKEKEKLDVEDNDQAKRSVELSKQQSQQAGDLAAHIQFYISQLKIQQKELKNNYELNKRVTEQIKEMESAYDDASLSAHQFMVEAANTDIERQLRVNTERLVKAQRASQKAEYEGSFISQEYQIDLFRRNQEDKVKGVLEERKALEKNKKELEDMLKIYEQLPSQAKQLRDAIDEVTVSLRENNTNLYNLRFDLSNSVINSMKSIYQKQLEIATKAYDDEYKEFEKMINKKLKLIDEEATEEQFNKDVADRTEQLNKLRDEIAQRTGDDSLANQKKLKDLQEQLKKGEEEYNLFLKNKNREDRKKALNEELTDKSDQINQQKEDLGKAFNDLLEDTRKFNQIQEALMEGQIEKYKDLVADLNKYVNEQMKEIGRSTSENLLDGLNESFKSLTELTELLKEDEKKNSTVPNSTLKPTQISEDTLEAIKKVNAISPTTILKDMEIKTTTPPKDVSSNKTSTTNNSTKIDNLVNIENFNGTKQETDKLTNDIANALRKQGQL